MKNNNVCPVCGSGHLSVELDHDFITYKNCTKKLPIRLSACDTCASETATSVDLRENKRIFNEFKKSVDGLLTGCEIKTIRNDIWQITQQQASAIFGGGPKAFSKYESDDVIQSEAMDKLIRLALSLPEALNKLREFSGEIKKIEKPISISQSIPIWHSDNNMQFESDELVTQERNVAIANPVSHHSVKIRTIATKVA